MTGSKGAQERADAIKARRLAEGQLLDQIKNVREGADEFADEHGSCRVTVGPNSPLALARVEQVAGYPIHVEQLRLIGPDKGDATEVDGEIVYFRTLDDRLSALDVVRSVDWDGGDDDD